ncbi:DUF423 domain-containing protein [Thiococcus pfennigii]|jgi:uncharacterized membrane protein YgdD (TMEM256/DUF423 family)|uniref:DUF423 domain-containing protein n=1 Tax=Thiococcus pfennigii TaxID=1057 RepID=UPI001F5BCA0B|nr:DUF423 domain-containing protein [Thiococcus pfennigii]
MTHPQTSQTTARTEARAGAGMARVWLVLGALGGLLSVALGAFGAHALRDHLAEGLIATWETATTYLGMHAIALLVCGLLALQRPGLGLIGAAAWTFLVGTLVFSGSLLALVLTGARAWGAVTPFGGVALLLAWGLLAVGAWRGLR